MNRDPREDPQPGDVLRVGVSRKYCRHVLSRTDDRVDYMADGQPYYVPLHYWRHSNRNAEVLHAQE